MFRAYQVKLDTTGSGLIIVSPTVESVEWDIYQITVQTGVFLTACNVQLQHNGFLLCSTTEGSRDCATGPPDIVISPIDQLSIVWANGSPNDTATAGIWYNENPRGTTYSSAH